MNCEKHLNGKSNVATKHDCYVICANDSNCMKSSNPHSGIYLAETSRTLDNNGGNPACNQGGLVVLVYESHNQDSRYNPLGEVCETVSAKYGTGGGNQPIVLRYEEDVRRKEIL